MSLIECVALDVVRESRGKKVLTKVLGESFNGVIVCGGWRPYRALRVGYSCARLISSGEALGLWVRWFAVHILYGLVHWYAFLVVSGVEVVGNWGERVFQGWERHQINRANHESEGNLDNKTTTYHKY